MEHEPSERGRGGRGKGGGSPGRERERKTEIEGEEGGAGRGRGGKGVGRDRLRETEKERPRGALKLTRGCVLLCGLTLRFAFSVFNRLGSTNLLLQRALRGERPRRAVEMRSAFTDTTTTPAQPPPYKRVRVCVVTQFLPR